MVLKLDARARRSVARELAEGWDPEGLDKQAKGFAHEVWLLRGSPPGWDSTIERECAQDWPGRRGGS